MKIVINSDGGARGNPGPAGIGVVVEADGKIHKISEFIGVATNNQAEYRAVIEALKWLTANSQRLTADVEVECFLDAQLIVEQLNGRYKLKNEGLKPLFWEVRDLILALGGRVSFKYISREKNKEADRLVNKALDNAEQNKS